MRIVLLIIILSTVAFAQTGFQETIVNYIPIQVATTTVVNEVLSAPPGSPPDPTDEQVLYAQRNNGNGYSITGIQEPWSPHLAYFAQNGFPLPQFGATDICLSPSVERFSYVPNLHPIIPSNHYIFTFYQQLGWPQSWMGFAVDLDRQLLPLTCYDTRTTGGWAGGPAATTATVPSMWVYTETGDVFESPGNPGPVIDITINSWGGPSQYAQATVTAKPQAGTMITDIKIIKMLGWLTWYHDATIHGLNQQVTFTTGTSTGIPNYQLINYQQTNSPSLYQVKATQTTPTGQTTASVRSFFV